MKTLAKSVCLIFVSFSALIPSHAQITSTWTGRGKARDFKWLTYDNWSAGTPGIGADYDTAIFPDAIARESGTGTIFIGAAVKMNSLRVDAARGQTLILDGTYGKGTGGFHFSGDTPSIRTIGNTKVFFTSYVLFDAAGLITSALGSITFNSGSAFSIGANNLTIDPQGAGSSVNILSNIEGSSASLIKNGAGMLHLSGTNTFSGGVFLNAGSIRVGNDRAFGTGVLTIGRGNNPKDVVTLDLANSTQTIENKLVWKNDLSIVNTPADTFRTISFTHSGILQLDGIRDLIVGNLVTVEFGQNLQITGTGGLNLKGDATANVKFLSAGNTFSGGYTQWLRQVTIGNGANDITLGALNAGHNYIGTGDISVSGASKGIGFMLIANPGETNQTNIRGRITLDWGAYFDSTGRTDIDGGTLAFGNNGTGNRFIFRGDVNFARALFKNSPDLYIISSRSPTVSGGGMGEGAGRIIVDVGSGNVLHVKTTGRTFGGDRIILASGGLDFGSENQIRAGTALDLGDGTSLLLNGHGQTFGALSWGSGADRNINFSKAGTLLFEGPSTGGTGATHIVNWTSDVTHLLFSKDISSQSWSNNLQFDGYDWKMGVQLVPYGSNFEVFPKAGAPSAPDTYEWTGRAAYSDRTAPNDWNLPGNWDINRVPDLGAGSTVIFGDKYESNTPELELPGNITVGNLFFSRASSSYNNVIIKGGTLTMDSGTSGVAARMTTATDDSGTISSPIKLNSDLNLSRHGTSTPNGSRSHSLIGKISDGGNGPKSIIVDGGAWYLGNTTNDFAGGVVLNTGGMLRIASKGRDNSLGKGELTINGGVLGGADIYNKINLNGSFSISNAWGSATRLYSTGTAANDTIMLDKDVTITGINSPASGFGNYTSLTINEGRDFRGTGALALAGSWYSLNTYAYNSDFSGGYTQRGDTMNVNATAGSATGNIVFGEISERENYLGIGNITLNGGNINASTRSNANHVDFRNGMTLSLLRGTFANNKADAPTILSNVNIVGSKRKDTGLLDIKGDLLVGTVTTSAIPNLTMSNNHAVKAASDTASLTGLGRFTRSGALTTTTIDPSIAKFGAEEFIIVDGRLKFTRDNQVAGTADVTLNRTGILANDGATNTFGRLTIKGASTIELANSGTIVFAGLGTWSAVEPISLLNMQNVTGIWNSLAAPAAGRERIFFLENSFSDGDARLNNIAFTGYKRGAAIIKSGTMFELVSAGDKGFEWSGAAGANRDKLWNAGGNWYGADAPDEAGAIAIFRDADPSMNKKTIDLSGSRTVGEIYFESTTGADFTISNAMASDTLTFDNKGGQSEIYFAGASAPTIGTKINIANTAGLLVNHRAPGYTLTLSNAISGAGGIEFAQDPRAAQLLASNTYRLTLSGSNSFTGGVRQKGGTLIVGNNYALGSGTYTVTGTSILNASGVRVLKNDLLLDGALSNHGSGANITFTGGTGYIPGDFKDIYMGNNSASMIFDANYVLTGPGGIDVRHNSANGYDNALVLRGQNTFGGGVVVEGRLRLGSSSTVDGAGKVISGPVGTGTLVFGGSKNSGYNFTLIEKPSDHILIANPVAIRTSYYGNATVLGYGKKGSSSNTLEAGSLTFSSTGAFTLSNGRNTIMPIGVLIEIKSPIAGSNSSSLYIEQNYNYVTPSLLRLSGSNSFAGGVSLDNNISRNLTLSLANDYALGTGPLTMTGSNVTIEAYGADRHYSNLFRLDGSGTAFFRIANGARSLVFDSPYGHYASGTRTVDVMDGMTLVFGEGLAYTGNTLSFVKNGGGEWRLLSPGSAFNGLAVNSGTVYTKMREGHDMAINSGMGNSASGKDTYFGKGRLSLAGRDTAVIIDTWKDGAGGAGNVYLNGDFTVSDGALFSMRGGGSLVLASEQVISSVNGGRIAIGDGGSLIKDGRGTTSVLNAGIDAPVILRAGNLSLATANLLSKAPGLALAGGNLWMNGLDQTLNGALSLAADSTIDIGVTEASQKLAFSFSSLGVWDTSSLLSILNWKGIVNVGEGTTRVMVNNYTGEAEFLPNIWFVGNAPGARLAGKGSVREIVPYVQTARWIGTTGDDWDTFTNWGGFESPNIKGASAGFGDDALDKRLGVFLPKNQTVGSLLFDGTKDQQFTIASRGDQVIAFDIPDNLKEAGGFGFIALTNNSDARIDTAINLNVNLTINNVEGADLEMAGEIFETGARKVTKMGDGVLTISSGSNTYSGGTELRGGTLRIAADEQLTPAGYVGSGAIGTGALAINNAAIEAHGDARTVSNRVVIAGDLTVAGTHSLTFAYDPGAVSGATSEITGPALINIAEAAGNLFIAPKNTLTGAGRLIKSGSGTLHLKGANEYTGGTEIRAGVLAISDSLSMSRDDLDFAGTGTLRAAADDIILANNINIITWDNYFPAEATIDTQSHLTTITGSITGAGVLYKEGTGTLALTAKNTLDSGDVRIRRGEVLVDGTASLVANGAIYVGIDRTDETAPPTLAVSGSDARVGTGGLYVGYNTQGSLIIDGGAVVTDTTTNNNTMIGIGSPGKGLVTITGSDSTLQTSGMMAGQNYGSANITVTDGAKLLHIANNGSLRDNIHIGGGYGNGTLNASGTGTVVQTAGLLLGESYGTGSMTLTDGAQLIRATDASGGQVNNVAVGYNQGNGTLDASGTGTRVELSILNIAGGLGTGTVAVSDGAHLIHVPSISGQNIANISIAADSSANGGTGALIASGTGTRVEVGVLLMAVGGLSNGLLRVEDGATFVETGVTPFTSGDIATFFVGGYHGTGSVFVSGTNTSFESASLQLADLDSSTAVFTVQNGATAKVTGASGQVRIGGQKSQGTLNIDGPGSTFTTATNIALGHSDSGQGIINITNGGKLVTEAGVVIGKAATGTGSVLVTGTGSVWEAAAAHAIVLGESGEARLTVNDGGLAKTGAILMNTDNTAATAVININATDTNRGILETAGITANSSTSAINFDGGILRAAADGELITAAGASAPLVIHMAAGGAFIDTNGHNNTMAGTLEGATATSDINKIGSGTLTLDTGATHTTPGSTRVAEGALVLDNATTIASENGAIADAAGTSARVALRNGSVWNTTGTLSIGAQGTGILDLESASIIPGAGRLIIGESGTGTLNMAAATTLHAGTLTLGANAGSSGTLNQNGGIIQTAQITKAPGAASSAIHFNSGTVVATADNAAFIDGFADGEVFIDAGGLILDTAAHAIGANSSIGGAGALTKLGAGTLALTISNTYQGGTDIQQGTIVMTDTAAIGTGPVNIAADASLVINTGPITFTNALSGPGTLYADLDTPASTFAFTANAGAAFTGTLQLATSAFALTSQNAAALRNATLRLDTGNHTTVATGTHQIGNLTLAGARLDIPATIPADIISAAFIQTGAITVIGGGTIAVNLPVADTAPVAQQVPLLQQDQGEVFAKLASATDATGAFANIDLLDIVTGAPITDPTAVNINQSGTLVATGTYDYRLANTDTAGNPGMYVSYGLKAVDILANRTLLLDGDDDTQPGADEFSVKISGSGNLEIKATRSITLSASSSYTGTTLITSGTTIAATSDALGHTTFLQIAPLASFDLGNNTQTIGGGDIAGALLGSGSLGLDGEVVITSANPALSASIGITGTTTINNTAALGDTGAMRISAGALLSIASGSAGTLSKTLDGEGTLETAAGADITLTGINTAFSGTFDIAATAALTAATAASLGSAAIVDNGVLTIANTADETLLGALSGAGTLTKQAAGNLIIARDNSAFTGPTLINSGTLTLQNLHGDGGGDITNNSVLALAASGEFANNITGGTTAVSSPATVNLAGANQTDWLIAGAAQVASTANLGDGDILIEQNGALILAPATAAGWHFTNNLAGAGLLDINLLSTTSTFSLGSAGAASNFTGTANLRNARYTLANGDFATATLIASTGANVIVGTGTQTLAGLAIDGGRIDFATTIPADAVSRTFVAATTLTAAAGTIAINLPGLVIPDDIPQLPLLQQDEGAAGVQLASSENLADISGLALVDAATGAAISNPQAAGINQSGSTVATGTYDYGLAATGANGNGLYATYRLTAVDIHADSTLVLAGDTDAPPGADNFTAKITGSGNLAINATHAITLVSSHNTYTGTTLVNTGTLIAGSDNALGDTSRLDLAPLASFTLGDHTQSIGALAAAETSTLDLSTGALTIRNGGTIAGALSGSNATLTLVAGTLLITSTNAALVAQTSIHPGATARLTNASALGNTGAIALEGALIMDIPPSSPQSSNLSSNFNLSPSEPEFFNLSLSGNGSFQKTGGGALTIAHANPGFTGAAAVQNGRLTITDLDALGSAPVDVSAGAVFELAQVTGAMRTLVTGSGTLAFASTGPVTIAHDNPVSNVTLSSALVRMESPAALGGSPATLSIDPASAIILGVDNAQLGLTTLDGGTIAFDKPAPGAAFKKAAIATLSGAGGTLHFNVDFSKSALNAATAPGAAADYLDITGDSSGSHNITIDSAGTMLPARASISIPLVHAAGSAAFQLPGGKVEAGLNAFELKKGDAINPFIPDTRTWYLVDAGRSNIAKAIIDTAAVQGIDWAFSLDSLYLRMGEIRSENPTTNRAPEAAGTVSRTTIGNIWLRTRGYRLNAGPAISGQSFHQYAWGVTAGLDKSFAVETGVNLLGGFLDMGNIDRSFDNHGKGSTRNLGAGVYFTMLRGAGYHADFVAKIDRGRQKFDARAVDMQVTSGRYNNYTYTISAEFGRRFQRDNGWWIEPAVQAAFAWIDGASYDTTPAERKIHIKVAGSDIAQYRALVRFGRQIAGSKWHPYGKFGAVAVDANGGEITAPETGDRFTAAYDGKRVEFGFGTMYRINNTSQVYLDYEYAKARSYERPWAVNLGYRRLW